MGKLFYFMVKDLEEFRTRFLSLKDVKTLYSKYSSIVQALFLLLQLKHYGD